MLKINDILNLKQEVSNERPGKSNRTPYQNKWLNETDVHRIHSEYKENAESVLHMLEVAFHRGRLDTLEFIRQKLHEAEQK